MDRQYQDMVDEDSMDRDSMDDEYTIVEICKRLKIQKKKWIDIAGMQEAYTIAEIYRALLQIYGKIDAEQIMDYW